MEFRILSKEEKLALRPKLLEMIKESDRDFVPPLSQRNVDAKSCRNTFSLVSTEKNLEDYTDAMIAENILAISDGDALLGFVTFAKNLVHENLPENSLPNIYIGTAILSPLSRGKGALTAAYDHLFNVLYADCHIFTRTWSTNLAHMKVLEKFGFSEIKRIPDDRGDGIDTIYFGLRR